MNPLIEKIYTKAKSNFKKIILVESNDPRVQAAAKIITDEKIADIILVDQNYISSHLEISNQLSQEFYKLRKDKGITLEESQKIIVDPLYFGTMMVKTGLADGMVAGAQNTTQATFKPALQIIKTKPEEKLISSFFIIEVPDTHFGENGIFIFADCGLNINPTAEDLSQIAIQSVKSFKQLIGSTPKVAMLSYSSNGSSSGESVNKVKLATDLVKKINPSLIIDGEIQADAAIIPDVATKKTPNSQLQGQANILIFPDLNSGNIAYKLVERLSHGKAFGPLTQGINKPINDLSRGCNIEDIVTTVAITSVQSISNSLSI
ncbi:MAG: phosphate acetyltransferase [Candidatus Shapirobacteria bacterium]|nr:phosphate acetyltransferase [Candidatus Shapirobacteria bacterium]